MASHGTAIVVSFSLLSSLSLPISSVFDVSVGYVCRCLVIVSTAALFFSLSLFCYPRRLVENIMSSHFYSPSPSNNHTSLCSSHPRFFYPFSRLSPQKKRKEKTKFPPPTKSQNFTKIPPPCSRNTTTTPLFTLRVVEMAKRMLLCEPDPI